VEDFSSVIGDAAEMTVTLNANHRTMCQFVGKNDDNYARVLQAIEGYIHGIELSTGIRPGK
jgi:hypothetical protein